MGLTKRVVGLQEPEGDLTVWSVNVKILND